MAYAAQQTTVKPVPTACPKCGGPLWDNRVGKKNPKAPDFKCRDKACDGVYWPSGAKERFVWGDTPVVSTPVTPINPALNDLPGDPANAYTLPQHQPVPTPAGALTAAQKALYVECLEFAVAQAGLFQRANIPIGADTIASMAATVYINATKR
jgi:hypothetical protein